jgi:hypothetical protein
MADCFGLTKPLGLTLLLTGLGLPQCGRPPRVATPPEASRPQRTAPASQPNPGPPAWRVVHVFVALCDNEHQGIVPVPAALGNGRDPARNLYWGAQYGVKGFFSRSPDWQPVRIAPRPVPEHVLSEAVFRYAGSNPEVLLFAQAFDGAFIKETLEQFLQTAAGRASASFEIDDAERRAVVPVASAADLVCFVGHDGFMDFQLDNLPEYAGGTQPRGAVVLACKSQQYFSEPLRRAHCAALLMTTGLMAPEAYVLDSVVRNWAAGAGANQIRESAAGAYAKYQKCGLNAARRLFVGGG